MSAGEGTTTEGGSAEEVERNSFLSKPVLVWLQREGNYVENIRDIVLRIKHPSKFGENVNGLPNTLGDLTDVRWEHIMKMRPTILELTHARNPLPQLIEVLRRIPANEVDEFFSRLRILFLDTTDVDVQDLLFILQKLNLLAAFSLSDARYTKEDWNLLSPELIRLNIRAVDINNDILNVLDKLNVELLKLSGGPGIKVKALQDFKGIFVTVQTLIAQELDYSFDGDAQQLVACIEIKFPRLKTLVFDWSIVDPEVTIDTDTKSTITGLIQLFKRLDLKCLAIIAYTPNDETRFASGELARFLYEAQLPSVRLLRFASKGLSQGQENFTVITASCDYPIMSKIHSIYVEGRTSAPDLRHLVQLLDDVTPPFTSSTVVEFGGFDRAGVRSAYEAR